VVVIVADYADGDATGRLGWRIVAETPDGSAATFSIWAHVSCIYGLARGDDG